MTNPLSPDRPCGSCTVCCSALGIEELEKYAGPLCKHLRKAAPIDSNRHCSIYRNRPKACSQFYCAWTFGLGPDIIGRPDRSGLMVVIYPPDAGPPPQPMSAVITIVDSRRCGEFPDPTSLIRQFIQQLLETGFTDIKILNRETKGVIYIADGVARLGKLRDQTSFEDLQFDVFDPPVGAIAILETRQ